MIHRNRFITALYLALLVLTLLVVGCDDTEIQISYDKTADFSSIATYSWAGRKDPEIDAEAHKRILETLGSRLDSEGFRNVDLNPDVYVTYFAGVQDEVRVDTRTVGYSTGPGWSWSGGHARMIGSSPEIRTYTTGSFVVDIHSAAKNQLIWRGVLSGSMSGNPRSNEKMLAGGLAKLFKHFPPEKSP